jgi:hypothetical protein
MRKITADTDPLVERFPGGPGKTGMFVAKGDMLMDEIADGLDTAPTGGRSVEQVPGHIVEQIGFAIAATQQADQALLGKLLYLALTGRGSNDVGRPRIVRWSVGVRPAARRYDCTDCQSRPDNL